MTHAARLHLKLRQNCQNYSNIEYYYKAYVTASVCVFRFKPRSQLFFMLAQSKKYYQFVFQTTVVKQEHEF